MGRRPEQPCGTRAAYIRHWRHGETPCAPCCEANRAAHLALSMQNAPTHGISGYINYGCRCDVCRTANTERAKTPAVRATQRRYKRRAAWCRIQQTQGDQRPWRELLRAARESGVGSNHPTKETR